VLQLDVLLLNSAKLSVQSDAVQNTRAVGKTLTDKGLVDEKTMSKINTLAKTAADKLKALDRFTGAEIGFFN
jgi:hypothetical protein